MAKTRTCAGCSAPLLAGVSDVFCPACALRRALAVGNATHSSRFTPSFLNLFRQIRRLKSPSRVEKDRRIYAGSSDGQVQQASPENAPMPGDVIADYEILDRIGGNMGLVFKARHRLLDKVVVLKLVPSDCLADPVRLTRFQREVRVMGHLEHPNLVTAADARSVGEWHLVAMEFIDGIDLQQLVRNCGSLSPAVACEIARQAATGLQYAHQHGLIHRDIKPSNVMLTRAGTIKVIDMGLALIRDDSTAQLTQTGLVLGTMSYCAPEQFRDASHVDIRADIYSLGCTLFNLLTGKSPYWQRKTIAEVMQAHLHEPFPSLGEVLPSAPAGLEAVLTRMTAKDREARYSTPGEVVEALESFARGADLGPVVAAVPRESKPRRVAAAKVTPARPPSGAEPRPKMGWQRLAAWIVLLIAIVVGGVVATKHDPVVVLMDTKAATGVYDADNRAIGDGNAKEVQKALQETLPPSSLYPEQLSADWARESAVIAMRPDLVIIHRSSFHHSYNAVFNFGAKTNGFAHPADDLMWRFLYDRVGDDKLITLLGCIGNEVPRTKFLVYSRGTDTNWLRDDFRIEWVKKVESRWPKLKGRITTMVIPHGYEGSFRLPETRTLLRSNVIEILGLPKAGKPGDDPSHR